MAKDDCWNQAPDIHSPPSLMVGEPSSRFPPNRSWKALSQMYRWPVRQGAYSAGGPREDDPIPGFHIVDGGARLFDDADSLVADHSRHGHHHLHVGVGVTHAGCLDADVYLVRAQVIQFDSLQCVRATDLAHHRSSCLLCHY